MMSISFMTLLIVMNKHSSVDDDNMVMTMMTINIAQEKHPSLPLFLVGHSMGGMIALRCVIRFLRF